MCQPHDPRPDSRKSFNQAIFDTNYRDVVAATRIALPPLHVTLQIPFHRRFQDVQSLQLHQQLISEEDATIQFIDDSQVA